MNRYLMYNIEYNKKQHTYNVWKVLYVDDVPVAFKSMKSGTKKQCELYAKQSKIKLDKPLPI